MSNDSSIIVWLDHVKNGDEQAAQMIWEHAFPELLRMARHRLPKGPGTLDDEEDVALSVMQSFFKAAQRGRFPDLQDRDGLWRLLSELTRRKVVDRIRRHLAIKQGKGELQGGSVILPNDSAVQPRLADEGAGPEMEAILREQIQDFLAELRKTDPRLEQLAIAKMEGATNQELADQFGRSLPTIERWLQRIRQIGQRILNDE